MHTSTPLYISTINLSETDLKIFQVALDLIEDEGVACKVLPIQDTRGHLVVIDMDSTDSETILNSLRPGQVKLVLSPRHMKGTNLVSIKKPIRVDSFKDVLLKICNKMYGQIGTSATPSHVTLPASPSGFAGFMQQLIQIKNNNQYCIIHLQNRQDLVIDGERQMLLSRESFENIISSNLSLFEQAKIELLSEKLSQSDMGNTTMTALAGFLWELAVKTSESILPAGVGEESKFSLKAWPNFTRHGFKPEHLKIAALLAKQAVSINTITEKTGLEQPLVQQFVNGCYAVGLLNLNSKLTAKSQNKPVDVEKKTLMKRLAYKLGFA